MLLLCLAIVAQRNCSIHNRFGVGSISVAGVTYTRHCVDRFEMKWKMASCIITFIL